MPDQNNETAIQDNIQENDMPNEHADFNPVTVPLSGVNLIEASAGTGKTYSIAILALRLILEKDLPIEKILMVTFTRDAAAEMKLRVRDFLRQGLSAAKGNVAGLDEQIVSLVRDFNNDVVAATRFENALLQFDKAAIYTIHSFCSKILGEYAFESGLLFNSKTLEAAEFDEYYQDAFNQSWRDQITILDESLLRILLSNGFSRARISGLVKAAIGGKKIFISEPQPVISLIELKDSLIDDLLNEAAPDVDIDALAGNVITAKNAIFTAVATNREQWIQTAENDTAKVKEKILPLLRTIVQDELFKGFKDIYERKYFTGFFPPEFAALFKNVEIASKRVSDATKSVNNFNSYIETTVAKLISVLSSIVFGQVEKYIGRLKLSSGQISFDDLIEGLHDVVCADPPSAHTSELISILQNRYQAVFIDELQDTDQLQFEIFYKVFCAERTDPRHILFFIGDPKQSIYAFRKADLQTYFTAAKLVDDVWRMNNNFRSTQEYIQAMNEFFQPTDAFDVFKSTQMKYYPVTAPGANVRTGGLLYKNKPINPLRILCCDKKPDILYQTINLVKQLLFNTDFNINTKDQVSPIKAGQIGILIRSKREGRLIRERLAKIGIPAVTISDAKVFESQEAIDIYYILKAFEDINIGNINRALLSGLAGYSWAELGNLHKDKLLQQFQNYQNVWRANGVYTVLRQFLRDTKSVSRKIEGKMQNADRTMANTVQLIEMLHETESDNKYSTDELIYWLKKGIEGDKTAEDQYLQRIESDEAAVKIVTMHSCKGLEYDIVIAPYLDMSRSDKFTSIQFRDTSGYYTADKKLLDEAYMENAKLQTEQENLRLLYVAITRARYQCYILSANSLEVSKPQKTALKHLQNELVLSEKQFTSIKFLGPDETSIKIKDRIDLFEPDAQEIVKLFVRNILPDAEETGDFAIIPAIELRDRNWQKTSYSKLTKAHDPVLRLQTETGDDPYDHFIFREIRRGAQSGNLLHDILERIDFTNSNRWPAIFKNVFNRYPGTGVTVDHETMMNQLLSIVTETKLPDAGFSLKDVSRSQRLSEFEFDMPLTDVNFDAFPELLESRIPLRINREKPITGILNGKIDLFFEQNGKYYLLDWKSNHLGNRAADYSQEAMATTMEANNYYLQYYLYCLALYRYLRLRIDTFDYEPQFGGVYYLFLRGMRIGSGSGIYYHKPALDDLITLEHLLLAVEV